MNAKIKKVIGEMAKVQAKISDLQSRLAALDKEKIELENLELIALCRGAKLTSKELSAFIKAHHDGDVPFAVNEQEETYYEEV